MYVAQAVVISSSDVAEAALVPVPIPNVAFSTKSDEESTGFSASYTMGGMTLGAVANKSDSIAGAAGTDRTFTEVSLAFAF